MYICLYLYISPLSFCDNVMMTYCYRRKKEEGGAFKTAFARDLHQDLNQDGISVLSVLGETRLCFSYQNHPLCVICVPKVPKRINFSFVTAGISCLVQTCTFFQAPSSMNLFAPSPLLSLPKYHLTAGRSLLWTRKNYPDVLPLLFRYDCPHRDGLFDTMPQEDGW